MTNAEYYARQRQAQAEAEYKRQQEAAAQQAARNGGTTLYGKTHGYTKTGTTVKQPTPRAQTQQAQAQVAQQAQAARAQAQAQAQAAMQNALEAQRQRMQAVQSQIQNQTRQALANQQSAMNNYVGNTNAQIQAMQAQRDAQAQAQSASETPQQNMRNNLITRLLINKAKRDDNPARVGVGANGSAATDTFDLQELVKKFNTYAKTPEDKEIPGVPLFNWLNGKYHVDGRKRTPQQYEPTGLEAAHYTYEPSLGMYIPLEDAPQGSKSVWSEVYRDYEKLNHETGTLPTYYSAVAATQGRGKANQVQDLYNNIMNNGGSAIQAKNAVYNTFGIKDFEPLGNDYRYPIDEGTSANAAVTGNGGGNGGGGNGGGGGNWDFGDLGGDLDVIYPYETVNAYTQTMTKQLLESLLGKGLGYNKLTDQFRKYLDEAVGDVREYGDTVLNSAYDTNATALNNMMNAMRTSVGSGITSGAGAGNMLATALQAGLGQVTDANTKNAETQQNIFKYISDLQSKKADIPMNAAATANATLAPIAEMLGSIYGSYLYGDVASMNDAKATALASKLSAATSKQYNDILAKINGV